MIAVIVLHYAPVLVEQFRTRLYRSRLLVELLWQFRWLIMPAIN